MKDTHKQFVKTSAKKSALALLKGIYFVLHSSFYAVFLVIPIAIGRLLLFCLTLGAFGYAPRTTTTVYLANEIRKNRKKIAELKHSKS